MNNTNITLIGMSGCGKTVVGQRTAQLLTRETYGGKKNTRFFDVDAEIEREQGMKITEIFEKFGETAFRKLEQKKIAELSSLEDVIISTGGGAVLDTENIKALKKNSVIVFIDRPVSDISANLDNSNRPLLKDKSQVYKLYEERIELYRKYADIIVENTGTVEEAAEKVVKLAGSKL